MPILVKNGFTHDLHKFYTIMKKPTKSTACSLGCLFPMQQKRIDVFFNGFKSLLKIDAVRKTAKNAVIRGF